MRVTTSSVYLNLTSRPTRMSSVPAGGRGAAGPRREWTSLPFSLDVLWACLGCAVLLDVVGAFKGLGFDPSFQLEAQPLFFLGIAVTAFFILAGAKLGPVLAGIIFWIPIVILVVEVVITGDIIPFGADIVGVAELLIAIVGVVAAHNVYHKFGGAWIRLGPLRGASRTQRF